MSRYDGLIIPRSYSEYINKTDAATLQQALQLSGVLSGAVAAGDNKAVKSSAVNNALTKYNYANANGLKSSDDFNNITTEGLYFATGAILPSNYPSGVAVEQLYNFVLHVYPQGNTSKLVQELTTLNGKHKYIRFYGITAGTWTDWEKFTTESDILKLITYKYGDDGLPPNSNLGQTILNHYNSTEAYHAFSAATRNGEEGYYVGFKHKTYGEGILISRLKLYFFIMKNGTISSKQIMQL